MHLNITQVKFINFFLKYCQAGSILCLIYFNASPLSGQDKALIMEQLTQQEHYWNAGDIDRFMSSYAQSDSIRFVSSNGINYGWHSILDRYKNAYPDKKKMGRLSFDIIELSPVSQDVYLCLGKYVLSYPEGKSDGYFSLIWKKTDGKWRIICDHTSASVKAE